MRAGLSLLRAGGDDERLKVGCSDLATRCAQGWQLERGHRNTPLHRDMSVYVIAAAAVSSKQERKVLLQIEARRWRPDERRKARPDAA